MAPFFLLFVRDTMVSCAITVWSSDVLCSLICFDEQREFLFDRALGEEGSVAVRLLPGTKEFMVVRTPSHRQRQPGRQLERIYCEYALFPCC